MTGVKKKRSQRGMMDDALQLGVFVFFRYASIFYTPEN